MTREILSQYNDLKVEIEKIRNDIEKTECQIEKLVEEGTVVDKVYGGMGGEQGFRIEGFPLREYERKQQLLNSKRQRLAACENDLIEMVEEIEKYILSIGSSRDRQILREVYIEGRTHQEVADEMFVERSTISKIVGKYL